MIKTLKYVSTVIGVFAVVIALAAAQAAEQYPHKPIRLVIPFPPGGSNDVVGRILAQKLTAQMGVQVIVDNRGGASGNIAIDIVSRAAPDGYTMLLNSSGIVLTPALSTKVSYDIFKDFSPVALEPVMHLRRLRRCGEA
jgi:tripartite-type tricarboxylate transporter receptor subunit TctC